MIRSLALLLLLAGCQDAVESQAKGDPRERAGGRVPAPTAQPEPQEEAAADPWAEEQPKPSPMDGRKSGSETEAAQKAAAQEAKAEEEKRDLGKELVDAMRTSVSCLGPRPDGSPPKVNVSLSARIMPAGNVLRGSVSGAGLAPKETECMEKRLLQMRFRTPIEGAPVSASGVLQLELRPRPTSP